MKWFVLQCKLKHSSDWHVYDQDYWQTDNQNNTQTLTIWLVKYQITKVNVIPKNTLTI